MVILCVLHSFLLLKAAWHTVHCAGAMMKGWR